jgi:hypothetical protein
LELFKGHKWEFNKMSNQGHHCQPLTMWTP